MRGHPERGAALLEVLIAVAVTAMLAAALTQATRFGLTVVERAEASANASNEALAARRKLADLLTRLDPGKADRDSTFGDAAAFEWHGVGAGDAGWRAGVWRLQIVDLEGILSLCPALRRPDACDAQGRFPLKGPLAYADADGVFVSDWPPGPPPYQIRVGEQVFAPRVLGGR